jgi:hypothetical protein
MTTQKLSADTINSLIGRTIYNAGDNWIQLDNGLKIYLEDSEIEHLNS